MKNFKKWMAAILCIMLLLTFVGCQVDVDTDKPSNPNNPDNPDDPSKPEVTEPRPVIDTDEMFYDEFETGISSDHWKVNKSNWSPTSGGVIPENINYTDDGQVILSTNGDYYVGDKKGVDKTNGKRTGALLESRRYFGPGSFEVKMKANPRFGATTAFWTYYYENVNVNHEIDIELNIKDSFKKFWNNSWTGVEKKTVTVQQSDVVHNDGDYHVYRFDWHTAPTPKVEFYLDGKLTATVTTHVPSIAMPINIGTWFPNGWAGNPNFEEDHAMVEYFKHTAYLDQPYREIAKGGASSLEHYSSAPIEIPNVTLVSNADFTGAANAWSLKSAKIEEANTASGKTLRVYDSAGYASQNITGTDKSINYKLFATVRGVGRGGYIEVQGLSKIGVVQETFKLNFSASDEFTEKNMNVKFTKDIWQCKIVIKSNANGEIIVDKLDFNNIKIYNNRR